MADSGVPRGSFAALGGRVAPILCTPEKPWGIHLSVGEQSCPRCGWAPGGRRAPRAGPAVPPIKA